MVTKGSGEVQPSSTPQTKRRYRSAWERRQIVEQTLQPGASVAIIARAHEVNANQVFCWRRLYRQGQLEAKQDSSELLAVRIANNTLGDSRKLATKEASGAILIEFGNARVRIEGAADPASIRTTLAALDSLRR